MFLHALLKCIRPQVRHISISTSEVRKGFLRRISEGGFAKLYLEPSSHTDGWSSLEIAVYFYGTWFCMVISRLQEPSQ